MARWERTAIYVCVRSYQAWLESILEDLGAQAGPRPGSHGQTGWQSSRKSRKKISAIDKVLVKPTAPVVRVVTNQDIQTEKSDINYT